MVIRDKNQGYCYFASTEIIIITPQFYGSNCLMHFDKKCWHAEKYVKVIYAKKMFHQFWIQIHPKAL